MKKNLLISIIMSVLGAAGGFFISQQTIRTSTFEIPDPQIAVIVLTVQAGVMTFILSLVGFWLLTKTPLNLMNSQGRGKGLLLAGFFALVTGFVIQGSDAFFFGDYLNEVADYTPEVSVEALLGGMFYGGIVEEVMMRLFGMTLIVFLLMKITKQEKLSSVWMWVSILLSAGLFAAGHLPANFAAFGELTPLIIGRAFLLNSIGGILFGWLYWKHGFWFSVLSHMLAHFFMQILWIPILF
ncbi:CPBP family intramembrane glutamic endopeptidase [Jeotgalibacillus sp. R-1-5s-1]|uniref:CPBP family intramembrane glutamic endopeptidase n=1 Tax=Jeotgalibacillus sp. R-1-5s-1 TaxID=2555897 RepID=UPI0010694785|nr:CPBP family intramembrane glutamic endopeptidase [Jeotgalibacillus sp. R-1-5s-1]TFE00086.1 CPBP family intramembrane metalloprotease [Jeotgalibacillus sp. R-1-5s-1]